MTRWNRSCQLRSSRQLRPSRIAAQCASACRRPPANRQAMNASEVRSPSLAVHVAPIRSISARDVGERGTIGQQQVGAELGQDGRGRAADAAGRAGDQDAPAPQVQCGWERDTALAHGVISSCVVDRVDLDQGVWRPKGPACIATGRARAYRMHDMIGSAGMLRGWIALWTTHMLWLLATLTVSVGRGGRGRAVDRRTRPTRLERLAQ